MRFFFIILIVSLNSSTFCLAQINKGPTLILNDKWENYDELKKVKIENYFKNIFKNKGINAQVIDSKKRELTCLKGDSKIAYVNIMKNDTLQQYRILTDGTNNYFLYSDINYFKNSVNKIGINIKDENSANEYLHLYTNNLKNEKGRFVIIDGISHLEKFSLNVDDLKTIKSKIFKPKIITVNDNYYEFELILLHNHKLYNALLKVFTSGEVKMVNSNLIAGYIPLGSEENSGLLYYMNWTTAKLKMARYNRNDKMDSLLIEYKKSKERQEKLRKALKNEN